MNLTEKEIDQLEAGKETDCIIAKHVLGFYPYKVEKPGVYSEYYYNLKLPGAEKEAVAHLGSYTENISRTFEVVRHLQKKGWRIFLLEHNSFNDPQNRFSASFEHNDVPGCVDLTESNAPTPELAICRAALKAVINGHYE